METSMEERPTDIEPPNESTRPIRALLRGLQALQSLNEQNGATVTEVAKLTELPRTTAYRILETLRVGGFAERDAVDERYRPTVKVRLLAEGYEQEAWIRDIARTRIEQLARDVVWPINIMTLSGSKMVVRETTDQTSPLALERYSAGIRAHVMATGGGQVYLSFCSDEQRNTLLQILAASEDPDDALAKETHLVEKIIRETRANGYATSIRPKHGENSLAVPILASGSILASLTMRYMQSVMTPEKAIEDFLARLQAAAKDIGDEVTRWRAEGKII